MVGYLIAYMDLTRGGKLNFVVVVVVYAHPTGAIKTKSHNSTCIWTNW